MPPLSSPGAKGGGNAGAAASGAGAVGVPAGPAVRPPVGRGAETGSGGCLLALGEGSGWITGVGAAVANAVHNATGRRIRELPITLDKLL